MACRGHNLVITEKAGTGKTFLLMIIFESIKSRKKCQIIPSTGIACTAYDNAKAMTIHSCFGLMTVIKRYIIMELNCLCSTLASQ